MFHGYKAFEEVASSSGVDAVQISTPPWFHVQHLDAVVAAGKHAYCEKPVGVDISQTKQALEIGKRADGRVSLDVGFQIRSAPPFVEICPSHSRWCAGQDRLHSYELQCSRSELGSMAGSFPG